MSQVTPDETLLGLLALKSQHGYQLLDYFRDSSQLGKVWTLSTSQLYAVLKRLEQQALIAGRPVESQDAPTRTEYTLTDAGFVRLQAWLNEPCPSASIRRVRVEFLSRLFIARMLNLPTQEIIQNQKKVCRDALAELTTQRQETPPGIGLLALELVIAQLNAVLQWIDRCEIHPHTEGD
ncbi:MAG: PadR family transcriptional regulator [Anaerolineae bacterium]|nr:PadR family transcriptional regulator [Anaerolineae bacterium]